MFTRGLSFAWLRGFDTCSRRKGRDKKNAPDSLERFGIDLVSIWYLYSLGRYVFPSSSANLLATSRHHE